MAALLPSGYSPKPAAGTAEQAALDVFSCQSLVIDNQTVIRDYSMAYVLSAVNPPSDVSSTSQPNSYVFDLIVNNVTAQKAWEEAGFKAKLGTISVQASGQNIQGTISIDGTAIYQFQAAGDTNPSPPPAPGTARIHQSDGTTKSWAGENFTDLSSVGAAGQLTDHGGVVEKTADNAMGTVPAIVASISNRMVIDIPSRPS
jgi:hypothetical protein